MQAIKFWVPHNRGPHRQVLARGVDPRRAFVFAARVGNLPFRNLAAAAISLATIPALAGCGMPAAPQPPSLNLPAPVSNLSAVRTGDEVALKWTLPTKNTDKIALKGNITVRVCRNEASSTSCSATATLELAPGTDGSFTDTLPAPLASGSPRALTYFIELDNRKGRSAGLSNAAEILAGQAPAPIAGLAAQMRRDGVLLRWSPASPGSPTAAVRLVRKRLSPNIERPTSQKTSQGSLAPPTEPAERTLLVDTPTPAGRALDADIRFGETYEYRAQRVERIAVNGKTLELAGALSPPVRIEAINVYPPAVPKGLAAVATPGENGAGPAIDLNWQPNTEADLAGYIVYRRESDTGSWQRVSSVAEPAYHDANVQPSHTYIYAVSAIDQQRHESERSAETQETVPAL